MGVRLVALISGSGTTLQNLIDRQVADIVGVIASKPGIAGIGRAEQAGIPSQVVEKAKGMTAEAYSEAVFAVLRKWHPDLICLCGWLKLLVIPPDFEQRVLNIHPSLLPKYGGPGMYGHHVHEAVLAAGEAESGCTVHYADNTYDTGEILVQMQVPVLAGDTPETLAKRVFAVECVAYPEAIAMINRERSS